MSTAVSLGFKFNFTGTITLILLNVSVYFVMSQFGGATYENLILFGAKENGLIAQGEIGRLFFPMFLHASLLHLLFNMYGLFQVGRILESTIGTKKLIFLYIFSGITGNLCSFALSPRLSVGASSSLFGMLLCLYVVQKYEEKLLKNLGYALNPTNLGFMIAFNAMLSFLIPNIDWASHLGGALAGLFIGLGLVAEYGERIRSLQTVRYVGHMGGLPPMSFLRRKNFYYFILAVVQIVFASTYRNVSFSAKAFGVGVKQAALDPTAFRRSTYLSQFDNLLSAPRSEVNPNLLLALAFELHQQGQYRAAASVYQLLSTFYEEEIGDDIFLSQTTAELLHFGIDAAKSLVPLPKRFLYQPYDGFKFNQELCERAARTMAVLGFFKEAGQLFECDAALHPSDVKNAARVVASYWKAGEQSKVLLFLNYLENLNRAHAVLDGPSDAVEQMLSEVGDKGDST